MTNEKLQKVGALWNSRKDGNSTQGTIERDSLDWVQNPKTGKWEAKIFILPIRADWKKENSPDFNIFKGRDNPKYNPFPTKITEPAKVLDDLLDLSDIPF